VMCAEIVKSDLKLSTIGRGLNLKKNISKIASLVAKVYLNISTAFHEPIVQVVKG